MQSSKDETLITPLISFFFHFLQNVLKSCAIFFKGNKKKINKKMEKKKEKKH